MPDDKPIPVIQYVTPGGRIHAEMYAGLYITLGAINIIAACVLLIFNGLILIQSGYAQFLPLVVISTIVAFIADVLIILGSINSFSRRPGSRRYIQNGLIVELVVTLFVAFVALAEMHFDLIEIFKHGTIILLYLFLRGGYAVVFLIAYANMRADFYFRDHFPVPTKVLPVAAASPTNPTFRVRGIDLSTGKTVQFDSKAATIELVEKSAAALGIALDSLEIEKL